MTKFNYYFNGGKEKYQIKWANNKKELYKKHREWVKNNEEKQKKYAHKWLINNREKSRETSLNYYHNHKKERSIYSKKYNSENKEKRAILIKAWRAKNKEKVRVYRNKNYSYRLKNDPLFAIKTRIINNIRKHLKFDYHYSKTKFINKYALQIKNHIESKFKNGMNWDNYGSLWQIDHIIPISYAKTEKEIYILNLPQNLQPLFSKENNKKGSKLPFDYKIKFKELKNNFNNKK